MGVRPEVLFALVYAVFLLIVSHLLRWRAGRMIQPLTSDRLRGSPESRDVITDVSWTHGLAARFRLGLSAALLVLAGFIILSAGWRFHGPVEELLLVGMAGGVFIDGVKFYRRCIAEPKPAWGPSSN